MEEQAKKYELCHSCEGAVLIAKVQKDTTAQELIEALKENKEYEQWIWLYYLDDPTGYCIDGDSNDPQILRLIDTYIERNFTIYEEGGKWFIKKVAK